MTVAVRRRWSKRTLVLVVLGIVTATAILCVGLVGFARSIGFVTRIGKASEVLDDVTQIAAESTTSGSTSVTPGANVPRDAAAVPAAGSTTAPSSGGQPEPVRDGVSESVRAESGVVPAQGQGAGGSSADSESNGGVASGAGGEGGGGATSTGGSGVLQSVLAMLEQNTTQMCGRNTCNVGEVCCNWSCGTCVARGATCDRTECAGAPRVPTAVRCGMGQCNDGQVCCNPSCGICAAPGATCSTETCP